MKSYEREQRSITKPLLKEIVRQDKANAKTILEAPKVGSKPTEPANLYQDAGEGYNPDFTFPQS